MSNLHNLNLISGETLKRKSYYQCTWQFELREEKWIITCLGGRIVTFQPVWLSKLNWMNEWRFSNAFFNYTYCTLMLSYWRLVSVTHHFLNNLSRLVLDHDASLLGLVSWTLDTNKKNSSCYCFTLLLLLSFLVHYVFNFIKQTRIFENYPIQSAIMF